MAFHIDCPSDHCSLWPTSKKLKRRLWAKERSLLIRKLRIYWHLCWAWAVYCSSVSSLLTRELLCSLIKILAKAQIYCLHMMFAPHGIRAIKNAATGWLFDELWWISVRRKQLLQTDQLKPASGRKSTWSWIRNRRQFILRIQFCTLIISVVISIFDMRNVKICYLRTPVLNYSIHRFTSSTKPDIQYMYKCM